MRNTLRNLEIDDIRDIDIAEDEEERPGDKYYYLAKMVDDMLYLQFYNKNRKLIGRHLNNGKKMVTETDNGITNNGFSKIIELQTPCYYYNAPKRIALKDSFNVVFNFLSNYIAYPDPDYDDENLRTVILIISRKKREEAKIRKKNRIKEMFSYLKPEPKDFSKFIEKQRKDYGFFKVADKSVYTTCCNNNLSRSDFVKFRHLDYVKCPVCGKKIQVYNDRYKKPIENKTIIYVNTLPDERLVFRYFSVRWNYKEPQNIKRDVNEYVRTVLDEKGHKNYEREFYNSKEFKECIDYSNPYSYYSRYPEGIHYSFYDGVLYTRNLRREIGMSYLKGLGIETMNYNPFKKGYYFEGLCEAIKEHPELELLLKAGCENIILALNHYLYQLNQNGKNPREILGLQKQYLNVLKKSRLDGDSLHDLYMLYKKATELGRNDIDEKRAKFIAKNINSNNWEEAFSYKLDTLKKIIKLCKENKEDFNFYCDYVNLVRKVGLSEKNHRYPKDLKKEHDRLLSLYKLHKDEMLEKRFETRAKELAGYNMTVKNLVFLIPSSYEDLKNESEVLHHCAYRLYSEKYAEGKTNLIFIRSKDDINKPLVTMEFKDGKVIQTRGVNNSTPSNEIMKAVEVFKRKKLVSMSA